MSYVLIGLLSLLVAYFVKGTFFNKKRKKVAVKGYTTIDDKFNASKKAREEELNLLLEKVSSKGLEKLSKAEKSRLEELSK